jgi:hypothetical protein
MSKRRSENIVNFLVVGAQKSGTTALHDYLENHPNICLATSKEVHFFDNDEYFLPPKPDYKLYHRHFNLTSRHEIVGEVTPSYMFWINAPRRIWEYNPEMKIIAILRNPIERSYSHWNMQRYLKKDNRSFLEAITGEAEVCKMSLPLQNLPFSYIARGFYTEQLRRLLTFFPRNQILIIRHENLLTEPTNVLKEIYNFLGIQSREIAVPVSKHCTPYNVLMSNKERSYLKHIFEFEIRQLERMLNWDCSSWM